MEYTFRLPSHDGAVLVLPRGATRYSLKDDRIFREAAAQKALEWYQFATSIVGQDLSGGFLCLVTGAYKARTWAHATFREVSENVTRDRVVRFGPNGDSPAGYAWTNAPAVDHRVCLSNQYEYENQSMFISGFNISVRDNVPHWVVMPVRAGLLDTLIRRLGISAMKWLSPSRTTVGMPMAMYYLSEIIGKSDDCAFSGKRLQLLFLTPINLPYRSVFVTYCSYDAQLGRSFGPMLAGRQLVELELNWLGRVLIMNRRRQW